MTKPIIYFLCTGNSCRSQMAEAWGKKHLSDKYDVYSAGIEAHGVNPKAIKAMNEVDIDISDQTSDTIDQELLQKADLVVTLCGHANDVCPATPPNKERVHWGFDDPAKAEGSEEDKWAVFQQVRDQIGERIERFAKTGE
ncbi:arsenate reductase (thioredoxin) [Aquibacillus halophilus]|uniref:Arsenate reductase n=1 Tax=Aquibacillus halophilus TaxID=930132 RepID=A0A6A8DCY8_9BACI|nr:arsenate reductase (thioredoxin) [Aquibacillus halophilus]MRH43555.1 arsenate reductase (thioredoxin) [Aquibacillus halophilus]